MSSATSGGWRRPDYRVRVLPQPLLLNPTLGSASPHGPADHTDRQYVDFVDAGRFTGAVATVDGTNVRTFTDGADLTFYAQTRIPKGITGTPIMDAAIYVVVPNGAAGNVLAGLAVEPFGNGSPIVATAPGLATTAVPSVVGDRVARILPVSFLLEPGATAEFMRLSARRDASAVQDNLNADLHLVGLYVLWTCDE